jgi:hypothetical protein
MRRALGIAFLIALCTATRAQNPHDEGIQAGRNAQPIIRGFINQGSASSVLPGNYNRSRPRPRFTLPGQAGQRGPDRILQHGRGGERLTCQAIRAALTSSASHRPPCWPPILVTGASAVANTPAARASA